jgi:hypothetical protein
VVRLVVRNIPRHVGRSLDHARIREYKESALQFQLDLRRPEASREVGTGAPARRATLNDLVRDYLTGRPLPADLDRETFVRLGAELVDRAEREAESA